jgi:hypothetical protein
MPQRTRDPEPPEKACSKCGEVKPLSEFYWHSQQGRHRPDCKDCCRALGKAVYATDPEVKLASNRAWARDHPEKFRVYTAKSAARFAPGGYRHRMSYEEWDRRWSEQDGKCYLCGTDLSEAIRVCIDHDHRCCGPDRSCESCRRGLACVNCNSIVGLARDNPGLLRQVADSLEIAQLIVSAAIMENGKGTDKWSDSRRKYMTEDEVREARRAATQRYRERKRASQIDGAGD